jgi:peptidyl-prolyl cis-trans isomerase SurA
MMRILILGISLFISILFIGCGASNPVLATIGDEKFSLHEFEDSYAKNNGGWDTSIVSSLEDRQKFLDLIVKFKLKVKEARAIGLEKDSAIVNELESYNLTVGQSYMNEKEVIEPGVQQLYNRKKEEVHASHILFRLAPNAKPADTLFAYEKAMKAIAELSKTPFDTVAVKFSEDPSVKTNNGDLGYFSGGRMVPEFEDACYSLKPGEYTKLPIRTQYGYHILKVYERQPNPGSVRISHILMKFNENLSDTAAIRDTIWIVYNALKSGGNFEEWMKKYTHDGNSIANKGDIGFYERERLPRNIADAFYKMKVNDVTEPMRFNYGFHIFRLTEKKSVPPLEETYKDVKAQYQQVRYTYENNRFIKGLRAKYNPVIDSAAVVKLISSIDTTKFSGSMEWKDTLSAEMLKTSLIVSKGNKLTVSDFADRVINATDNKGTVLSPANIWMLVTKYLDNAAVDEHARDATKRHPVLASLLKEYEEGVLLYRIEQDEVWKKVMVNDSILNGYYATHKGDYRWPDRVNFAEIYTLADSASKAAYWCLQYGEDFSDVAENYTNRPGYKEKKGEWGFQPFTYNELTRKASKMAVDSITAPFKYENGWSIIKTIAIDSARIKNFEEAMPEVASAYQETASKQREQDWVKELEKKYPVVVNKEVLKEAFKRKRES